MNKLPLRYTLKFEAEQEYTKKDIENDDQGLTQALLVLSMIEHDDGSYSQVHFSFDGKTKSDITDNQLFKAATNLIFHLVREGKLKGWKRELCEMYVEKIKEIVSERT